MRGLRKKEMNYQVAGHRKVPFSDEFSGFVTYKKIQKQDFIA